MNEWQNDQKLVVNDARLRKIQIAFEKLVRENYELKARIDEMAMDNIIRPLANSISPCYGCERFSYPGSVQDICCRCSRFYKDLYIKEAEDDDE